MKEALSNPSLFVIRFWLERSGSVNRWRGSIEHIPGGSQSQFLGIQDLLRFLQRFEITLDEAGQFTSKGQKAE